MPGEACWKLISWMPGRPQLRESRARYDPIFEKKNGRATSGDRGGEPTVQVARPLLGTDAVCLGGGDCQRNRRRSKHRALKKPSKFKHRREIFFSFCDSEHPKVSNSTTFPAKTASFASCDLTAGCDPKIRISRMHPADCARQNPLDKSALGIQAAAIHRIVCRARRCTNRLANKTDMRTVIG